MGVGEGVQHGEFVLEASASSSPGIVGNHRFLPCCPPPPPLKHVLSRTVHPTRDALPIDLVERQVQDRVGLPVGVVKMPPLELVDLETLRLHRLA